MSSLANASYDETVRAVPRRRQSVTGALLRIRDDDHSYQRRVISRRRMMNFAYGNAGEFGVPSLQSIALQSCVDNLNGMDPEMLKEHVPFTIGEKIWKAARSNNMHHVGTWVKMRKAYGDAIVPTSKKRKRSSKVDDFLHHVIAVERPEHMAGLSIEELSNTITALPTDILVNLTLVDMKIGLGSIVSFAELPNLATLCMFECTYPDAYSDAVGSISGSIAGRSDRHVDSRVLHAWHRKAVAEKGFPKLQTLIIDMETDPLTSIMEVLCDFPKLRMIGLRCFWQHEFDQTGPFKASNEIRKRFEEPPSKSRFHSSPQGTWDLVRNIRDLLLNRDSNLSSGETVDEVEDNNDNEPATLNIGLGRFRDASSGSPLTAGMNWFTRSELPTPEQTPKSMPFPFGEPRRMSTGPKKAEPRRLRKAGGLLKTLLSELG